MSSNENCPSVCVGCPLVPEGIKAKLTAIKRLPEQEMNRFMFWGAIPAWYMATARSEWLTFKATLTVTESTKPDIEAGDQAEIRINNGVVTTKQIRQGFDNCTAPTQPSKFDEFLGKAAVCNGLQHSK